MKHLFKPKRIFKLILMGIIFGLTYSLFFTVFEDIKVKGIVNDFVSRANTTPTNIEERSLSNGGTYIRKYFEVPRETNYEQDGKNVFLDSQKTNFGQIGDIYVTQQSPFPNVFGLHQFMSYYYGGHAALKIDDNTVAEATGYPDFENESLLGIITSSGLKGHGYSPTASMSSNMYWYTTSGSNYYYDNFYRTRYMGLRPINPGLDTNEFSNYLEEAVNVSIDKIENEALYNFLFFLNMRRKYYCTDFVSRVYEEAYEKVVNSNLEYESKGYAKRMNDDGFITSVNDLILSKDTYLTFYVQIDEEDYLGENKIVEKIYYLEDVE